MSRLQVDLPGSRSAGSDRDAMVRVLVTCLVGFLLQAVLCQGGAARLQALRRAAVLGSPAACYYVAVALLNGDGISRDSALAMDYLKVAVDAGDPPAWDLRKELQPGGTMKIPGTASSRIQYLLDEIAE